MSDKPKRKTKPKRRSAKLLASIAVIMLLIFVAFILNWQSHKNTFPTIYQETATQIIVYATHIFTLEEEGCERSNLTNWDVNIFFDVNAEIDIERSYANNGTRMSNWLCDDGYRLEHTEYYVDVFSDIEDINLVSIIDDIAVFLKDYPPDNVPALPPLIIFSIAQSPLYIGERYSMDYTEMMNVFDSGLRGSELLAAVATPIE